MTAWIRFLIVACPTCGAPVNQHCVAGRSGNSTMPHIARRRLAAAQPNFQPLTDRPNRRNG